MFCVLCFVFCVLWSVKNFGNLSSTSSLQRFSALLYSFRNKSHALNFAILKYCEIDGKYSVSTDNEA